MDDCVLACGGTIAKLPQKENIHVIYATDGMGSPAPVFPGRDFISPDLGELRIQEAQAAMGSLGVPRENIYFLGLPDNNLKNHREALSHLLSNLIQQIKPDHILMPFRYDRHPDHLALTQTITTACGQAVAQAELTEYFVYYRWRLLAKGDVRKYIHPPFLLEVNIEDRSTQKRAALAYFKTQTTKFYDWQTRPNLLPQFLEEVSWKPEFFLRYKSSVPGAAVFAGSVTWIRLAHSLEPFLKRKKDQAVALWRRGFYGHFRKAG